MYLSHFQTAEMSSKDGKLSKLRRSISQHSEKGFTQSLQVRSDNVTGVVCNQKLFQWLN